MIFGVTDQLKAKYPSFYRFLLTLLVFKLFY